MKISRLTDLRVRYFFVCVLMGLYLIGCHQSQPKFNVLIITLDTTRADHIGSYDQKSVTPHLDDLSDDGIVYERALSSIPITLPSHSSIMTGKVPFVHGVRDNGLFNLTSEQLTLAEILKKNGYKTAATIASFPLTSKFGINQGFDYFNEHIAVKYEDMFGERTLPKSTLFFDERNAAQVNETIMPWIQDNHETPFFAWIHYFDPHHPHEPPAPYDQTFVNDLYRGEIAYADENIGKVIEQLKRLNIYDNTLIVFTSDHGEGNNEHNESTHSLLVYNSTLHVPLIIKHPNQAFANTRVKQWVGLIDIFPTVLDQLGIDIPDDIQGQTLPTTNNQANENREIYAETLSPRFSRSWGEQRSLIKNDYKYIYGPQKELYNLANDQKELNNLVDEEPQLAASMKQDLQDYLDEYQVARSTSNSVNLDSNTLNTLRGLGYIQSTGNAVDEIIEVLNDQGDPPQKHITTISTYSHAKNLIFKEKHIEAIRYLDALLLDDEQNLAYLELKVQSLMMLGDYQQSQALLEALPESSYGTLDPAKKLDLLARIAFMQGDNFKAKQLFKQSNNLEYTIEIDYFLAMIAAQEGDFQERKNRLNSILAVQQDNIRILNDLAICYSILGEFANAEELFKKAIITNPFHQLSRYNYGVFLNSVNDRAAAKIQIQKAIDLDDLYLPAHYALVELLIKENNVSEAEQRVLHMKAIAPHHEKTKQAITLLTPL